MGADVDEPGDDGQPDASAQPQHSVKVANFELAYYELTVAQFRKFVDATGYLTEAEGTAQPGCQVPVKGGQWLLQPAAHWRAPGFAQTDSHPVVCLSWNDAQAYLQWLNGSTERFRLPTEAEWEFAARAGTTTPRPWSDAAGFFARTWNSVKPGASADQPPSRACKYANVADEALRATLDWPNTFNCRDGYPYAVPGGYYGRNNFSLYDMMGNAAEWTQDCWNPSHAGALRDSRSRSSGDCARHVVRGGSWASAPATIRSAARQSQAQTYRAADLGLRLARTPKE
jgi:formylglycine-generating enzyme required for sulfatase activity